MLRFLAAVLTATFAVVPQAGAAEPIMPLAQVQAGMQCTGLSVVRGTEVSSFSVEVLDVVAGEPTVGGPRILVRVSGPAVDETGVGPGFSGSPILCADADGVQRTIGAVSEAVGEYGGKVVLATPIEAILGTPVDAPGARPARRLRARARPLAPLLTVGGLSPALGAELHRAVARRGQVLLAAPAGPLGSFAPQQLRPGAAFGASYATGDLRLGAIGTVTYVDGASVWGFGHFLEGLGRRSLFLQDAYVFRVVNNPVAIPGTAGTYKLAATGHDVGTLTNDAPDAVVGRLGALPPRIPVRIRVSDLDRGVTRTLATDVADETDVDQPPGSSALAFVAPLAVAQATGSVLAGAPARLTGTACVTIGLRERSAPARFCNRYVTEEGGALSGGVDGVGSLVASDVLAAVERIDGFKLGRVHVTSLSARVTVARGERLAYLRQLRLPRRVRAGERVPATLLLRHVRDGLERRRIMLRLPHGLEPGLQRVRLVGRDADFGGEFLEDLSLVFGDEPSGDGAGPPTVDALARSIQRIGRYDGLRMGVGDGTAGTRAYRAPDVRIAGRASAVVRVAPS